jgi:ABC-type Fe3+ transport system permease subunit
MRNRLRVPSAQTAVGTLVIVVTAAFVVYPIYYLIQASLDIGDPEVHPPTEYGFDNFAALPRYSEIMMNTLFVALAATAMALVFGFITAWILNRTNVPFRRTLEQAMAVPYYVTPLLGALAWSLLGSPESGLINQVWRAAGGSGALINIISPMGIAWVMALFEGSVAFVMIGAVMKSMDPALEEASQINGGGRFYTMMRVTLPLATLVFASVQRLAVAFPAASNFTLDNYRAALSQNAVRFATWNSLLLGVLTATIGVALTGMLSWLIHRSRIPGRGLLEYTVMFPQAVPRLVFAFGMMWAWLVLPIPIYGTLWLLLIAYLTVFLPLGVRTISSVMLQLDKSLEECGEVCGASWGYRMRTITMPLLRPGLVAAWMLLFIASVRELGASILLTGPHSQVLTPAIVNAWFATSSELTAAMALIQTLVVAIAVGLFTLLTRRATRQGG